MPAPTIEAVFLDFDGTLVDSEHLHYDCWMQTVRPFGGGMDWPQYNERLTGRTDLEAGRVLLSEAGHEPGETSIRQVLEAKRNAFHSRFCVELSIGDVSVQEGDAGTSTALFTVSRSGPASETVQVDYATVDGSAEGDATIFSNPATITIPSSGEADPYPSTIVVPDAVTSVSKVTVTLLNFSHTFPTDVDILLVGPGGNVLLMSDAGGSGDVSNLTLTFDDAGASLPQFDPLVSGTYRPTNFGGGDAFPAPAPADPYGAALSVFNGTDPSGTWALYVVDDFVVDSGSIIDGWKLTFEGTGEDYVATSGTLTFPPSTTSQTIAVTVNGDTLIEQHETFFVNLTNATNAIAIIADGQGTGTILSDDFVPRLLTVSRIGTGTGTVTSSPAGIDCGNDCQEGFPSGQLVTLTPTAASGSLFSGWSGDADCSDGMVTMSEPHNCSAVFNQITY